MKKSNGYTLVEILISASILMTVISTMFPLIHIVTTERMVLSERRTLVNKLHDDMQAYLWERQTLPVQYNRTINKTPVSFNFSIENRFLKGCVDWENVKKNNERHCFYGLQNK